MTEEKTPTPQATPKPAAKKPKEPALEDKPFSEFIEQHFTPTLKTALQAKGLEDVNLIFKKDTLPLGAATEQYYQIVGTWQQGKRQFNLYFLDEDINGKKAFTCSSNGSKPSTIESFMIDERKASLDLMVLYTLQRLNGQKWLSRN